MTNQDIELKARLQISNADYVEVDTLSIPLKTKAIDALELGLSRPKRDKRTSQEAHELLEQWAIAKRSDKIECRKMAGAIKGSAIGNLYNATQARKMFLVHDQDDQEIKLLRAFLRCPEYARKVIDHHYIDRFTDKFKHLVAAKDDEGAPYEYLKTPPVKIHVRDNLKLSWRSYSESLRESKQVFISIYRAM